MVRLCSKQEHHCWLDHYSKVQSTADQMMVNAQLLHVSHNNEEVKRERKVVKTQPAGRGSDRERRQE